MEVWFDEKTCKGLTEWQKHSIENFLYVIGRFLIKEFKHENNN